MKYKYIVKIDDTFCEWEYTLESETGGHSIGELIRRMIDGTDISYSPPKLTREFSRGRWEERRATKKEAK